MIFAIFITKTGSYQEYRNISHKSIRKDEQCNRKINKTLEKPIHKVAKWPKKMLNLSIIWEIKLKPQ